MSKKIIKKENGILGGKMKVTARPKDGGKSTYKRHNYDAKRDLKKYGLVPVEQIESVNPITGEKKMITIRRDGTTDQALAAVLADPNSSRGLKDTIISRYLWEQGKESASMMMDLWKYKGEHTKESRHWMSNMRFDFELFMEAFMFFLNDGADRVMNGLGLSVEEDKKHKRVFIKRNRVNYLEEVIDTLGELALYMRNTSDLMRNRIEKEKQKREQQKGGGIYIGLDGKPYSIYEDGDVVDAVKKDKKKLSEENKK